MAEGLDVVAMHGWVGDARAWEKWRQATASRGWTWQCGERGYGQLTPREPAWSSTEKRNSDRLAIGHSLGPHLIPADVLGQAESVVLLASFATFVPPGRAGRRLRTALAGMAASLDKEDRARGMLEHFMTNMASPQSPDLLPPGPLDGPINADGMRRLREDLQLLGSCEGLPRGFPQTARVLIVEAEDDHIVDPEARAMLRQALPQADVITLPGTGHALLRSNLIECVVAWVENR